MASWWSLCPDVQIKWSSCSIATYFPACNQAHGNVQIKSVYVLDIIIGGNSQPMFIPGEILQGPKSTHGWSSSLRVQYLKVSIQTVIGLKQQRDQDSLNTIINKNYTLIMSIKHYGITWIVPKLSWNHSRPQNYHVQSVTARKRYLNYDNICNRSQPQKLVKRTWKSEGRHWPLSNLIRNSKFNKLRTPKLHPEHNQKPCQFCLKLLMSYMTYLGVMS